MLEYLGLLGTLFEILEMLLFPLDVICLVSDVVCWFKGKPNRRARNTAKREGQGPPPRNGWNKALIVFTVLVLAITAYLLVSRHLRS